MSSTIEIVKIRRMSSLTNELHYQFHWDLIEIIKLRSNEVLVRIELVPLLAPYYAAFEQEKDALDVITKSKYSLMMARKDHERDETYNGFVLAVKAVLHHPEADMSQSAERAIAVLNHYGDVTKKRYDEETAAIDDIEREFQHDDLKMDINKIGVAPWLTLLVILNNEFKELAHLRYQEKNTLPPMRMKAARVETDKYYRHIVQHVSYLQNVGRSSNELREFIQDINVLVTHYNNVMAHYKNKPKQDQDNSLSEE